MENLNVVRTSGGQGLEIGSELERQSSDEKSTERDQQEEEEGEIQVTGKEQGVR